MNMSFDDLEKAARRAVNIAVVCMMHCLGEDVKLPEKKWIELAMGIFMAGEHAVDDKPEMYENVVSIVADELSETEAE